MRTPPKRKPPTPTHRYFVTVHAFVRFGNDDEDVVVTEFIGPDVQHLAEAAARTLNAWTAEAP